ncbi:hypothetical protein MRB53_019602 [Persea americana]|uniref:Uncharacterized protein n=1 Tax=Persea americana TaxID=3435 RepID=A0ACC2KYP5_PERAE|nr:hypothetical protein MRB53_019602 [Persea americana]
MAPQDLSHKAGEMKGQAEVKNDQMADSASNSAQAVKESCQPGQENTSNFVQQTGDQMKGMAQGAADAMKSTLGVEK